MEDVISGTPGRPKALAQRACDTCRSRKRRCVIDTGTEGAACTLCVTLGSSCQFTLPTKARGPKRRQGTSLPASGRHSDSLSPAFLATNDSPQLSSPASSRVQYPTDELVSRSLLHVILDDYLDVLDPLYGYVHPPTFRQQLADSLDCTDPDFFALLVSLVANTVALLPSRYTFYKSLDSTFCNRFDERSALIYRCSEICRQLRTGAYWDQLDLRKWIISFCLFNAFFQMGSMNTARMFEAEAIQIGRLLHFAAIGYYDGLDPIQARLRKNAFWHMFFCQSHTLLSPGQLANVKFLDDNETTMDLRKLMPDVSEDSMSPSADTTGMSTPPMLQVTSAIGFSLNARIFQAGMVGFLKGQECRCGHGKTRTERIQHYQKALHDLRYVFDDLPDFVSAWLYPSLDRARRTPGPHESTTSNAHSYFSQHRSSAASGIYSDNYSDPFAMLRVNVHMTHSWLRMIIVNELDLLLAADRGACSGHECTTTKENWAEREDICQRTLEVLRNSSYEAMEPNGNALVTKVRDIATSMLECPYDSQELPALRAARYLRDFSQMLSRLDHSEELNLSSVQSWVDTDRIRNPV
ncbi:hypothetical protein KVT40_002283 [Elsinoe batatas]|uniref:Zn(2)-C6 fungal-type domain-containing protein n=1 Tax=Elsinoe batatas TaxID=2601811 RepID=A0A8K0L6K6_9PEZI|nr:hypothetical protein KVT40_002283 [Elsinoe batatas]